MHEQLDYEPGRFLRRRVVRRKYVHKTNPDFAPILAALPQRLLDRSLPAPGLLAHIVVGKYCDHLPLYRQEQIYRQRHGVHLPRQSLTRWVELAADWLKPIYEHIRTGVMGGGYVQVDETPVDYLEPGHGKTKQGYLWTCSRPGGDVFYRWETSRAAACLDKIIPWILTAPSSAMATGLTVPLPMDEMALHWPGAGRTCGASSSKPWNNHPRPPVGSCGKSNTCTGWKPGCVNTRLAPDYAKRFAPTKANPSWNVSVCQAPLDKVLIVIIIMRAMTSTSSPDSSTAVPSPPIQNVPVTMDSKGRVRASKEQRRVILAEFERSGVSAAQFAKRTGLKYSTLAGWLQRYRRAKPRDVPDRCVCWKRWWSRHTAGDQRRWCCSCPAGRGWRSAMQPGGAGGGACCGRWPKPC